MLEILTLAFNHVVLDPAVMISIFVGVFFGIIFGAVPGLSSTLALVMFLPLTFTMTPVQAISMLISLYIGGQSGGFITSILLNIPGTPSAVATCFDGHPMAKKGEAGKAIGMAIIFSFFGTLVGIALLILISPSLANVALRFGPYEYAALMLFSLSLVVMLTGKDMVKGLISAVLGGIFATVGLAPIDSRPRFTFDMVELTAGFKLVAFLIGIFAITEVLNFAQNARKPVDYTVKTDFKIKGFGFSIKEFFDQLFNGVRSALVGVGIGLLPGIGGGISNMLAYTIAKKQSKYPEKFGTGIPDGLVAPETANSATIGGSMVPTLALGIPGDPVVAVLLGGFLIHGIAPGPLIFENSGDVVYGIFLAMVIASFMMLVLNFFGMRLFVRILKIPKNLLLPVIVTFCIVGAIGDSNSLFDAWGVVFFSLVGFFCIKSDIPLTPMILGFILGPMFELHLRRSSQLFVMDSLSLFRQPIALVFLIIIIIMVVTSVRSNMKANSKNGNAK